MEKYYLVGLCLISLLVLPACDLESTGRAIFLTSPVSTTKGTSLESKPAAAITPSPDILLVPLEIGGAGTSLMDNGVVDAPTLTDIGLSLDKSPNQDYSADDDMEPVCISDSVCYDSNPATLDRCIGGECVHTLRACEQFGFVCGEHQVCPAGMEYIAADTMHCCLQCDTLPYCGDLVCQETESYSSCPADCDPEDVTCPNGVCDAGETSTSCPADCPMTGCVDSDNGVYPDNPGGVDYLGDTFPDICAMCEGEECSYLQPGQTGNTLSEKYCTPQGFDHQIIDCPCYYDPRYVEYDEEGSPFVGYFGYCMDDSPPDEPDDSCGDGMCVYPETPFSCASDCQQATAHCPNGMCEVSESPSSCPEDCIVQQAPPPPTDTVADQSPQNQQVQDQPCVNCMQRIPEQLLCTSYTLSLENSLSYEGLRIYILGATARSATLMTSKEQVLNVEEFNWYKVNDAFNFYVKQITVQEVPYVKVEVVIQICGCGDGLDNDEDELIDYPADADCSSERDPEESAKCVGSGLPIDGRLSQLECCETLEMLSPMRKDLPSRMGYCWPSGMCGDQKCDTPEDSRNCPSDCHPPEDRGTFLDRVLKQIFHIDGLVVH